MLGVDTGVEVEGQDMLSPSLFLVEDQYNTSTGFWTSVYLDIATDEEYGRGEARFNLKDG